MWRRLALTALAALAAAPYLGSLSHPLLHDDRTLLGDNPWLAREAGAIEVFTHDFWQGTRHAGSDLYRPLTVLTLAWNLHAARTSFGFRAVNVLFHVAAVLAVLAVLERVLARLEPERGAVEGRQEAPAGVRPEALAGAALFAVHPLASQAVLTAVGRAELMAALFGLMAFFLVLDAGAGRRRASAAVGGSAALVFAALCSKESAAAWVVVLALWWAVARRRAGEGRVLALAVAAWAGSLAVFLVARGAVVGWTLKGPHWVDNPLVLADAGTRVANAVLLQGLYLFKMALPLRLSVEYGYDQIRVLPLFPSGLPGALALATAWTGAAFLLGRASRAALWSWALVPAAFAVTANVVFPIGTIFAERLAYLPLVGGCGLAGWGICRLMATARARLALAAILVIVLGSRTVVRARDYQSLVAFDEATAGASPRSVKALANVGRTRLRTGRPAEAAEPLERAIALWPDYPRALSLLADAYERLGRRAEAERYRDLAEQAASRWRGAPAGVAAGEE